MNYGFRVVVGKKIICGNQPFAYINASWNNYQATAALLTSAWLVGKTVTIYTSLVEGYCEVGYVVAQG